MMKDRPFPVPPSRHTPRAWATHLRPRQMPVSWKDRLFGWLGVYRLVPSFDISQIASPLSELFNPRPTQENPCARWVL
jgi:hypothetical protein